MQDDRLKFLSSILKSIIEVASKRDDDLAEYFELIQKELTSSSYNVLQVKVHATNDLYRLCFVMDPDIYFQAYINRFRKRS